MIIELIVGTVIILVIGIIYFSIYNNFILLKNNISKSWSNINVLLKQRFNEIPNLVNTCKGYMKHERGTFKEITEARTAWSKAKSTTQKIGAGNMMAGALKSLFAVAENYPKLQANENFKHLQSRVSEIETQIARKREYYNDNVNGYNVKVEQFPTNIVANLMSLKQKKLFETTDIERKNVKIQF